MLLDFEIQQAIYNRLSGDPTLTGLVTGIYDAVPQPTDSSDVNDFPFITVGDLGSTDWSTDTDTGTESFNDIHVFSRYNGTKEIKDIQQIIYNLLNRFELPVSGGNTVLCDFDRTTRPMLDPDGKTRHGVIGFRILVDEQ